MKKEILLINGPNLNMLGKRDPTQYGVFTLADVEKSFSEKAEELGYKAVFFQSNCEGEIVIAIHKAMTYAAGIVINAGAYTHYSYAILDAIELCGIPVMEVHISNIHEREIFRHRSVIKPACVGQVYGLGINSYTKGLEILVNDFISKNVTLKKHSEDNNNGLSEIRKEITSIDEQMISLFNKRLSLSEQVAKTKAKSGSAVFDPTRENVVIEKARENVEWYHADAAESLMRTIMRLSREYQYELLSSQLQNQNATAILPRIANGTLDGIKKVAYGGTVGSYSEKAARTIFPSAELYSSWSFGAACSELISGNVDAVVLPLANTTGGPVDTVYKLLQQKLFISRYVDIPIEHCLAVIPGTKLDDIEKVFSHPQALSQCSKFIEEHKFDTENTENTAYAPDFVKKEGYKAYAAICSIEAAKENGLEVLCEKICNTDCNLTRFIAVTRDLVVTADADRLSIILQVPHRKGALSSTLDVLTDKGLNLASICSQPVPDTPWEYAFFIDICVSALDRAAMTALCQLSYELPRLQIMGWYGAAK